MYFVKYGKDYLHDPRADGYQLLDLSLDCEENSCGYCDFTIYPNHPMYGKLKERDADNPIEVYDDDILLFTGFIYELGKEFYLSGQVKCKGELDYLSESIVRPYSTLKRGYGSTAPYTVDGYFEWLIEQHNSQVSANKQFKIGRNQGANLDTNNYIYRENDGYPTTIEEISEKLLGNLGGYLQVRHENGERYIDYLSEWTESNSQILDFGVNLTDYTQTDDSSSISTFVIPTGARLSETNYDYNDGYFKTSDTKPVAGKEYYTISSEFIGYQSLGSFDIGVTYYEYDQSRDTYFKTEDLSPNSSKTYYVRHNLYLSCSEDMTEFEAGVEYFEYNEENDESNLLLTLTGYPDNYLASTEYINRGDMLYSASAVANYGWIGTTIQNSDITTKDYLIKYALIELMQRISPKRTIEIKAVDMHFVNPDIKPIRIGEYVRVRSKPHNLDNYFLCRNIDLDLNNPENSTYTLGTTYDTLTGEQNKRAKQLDAEINKQYEAAKAIGQEAKDSAETAKTAAQAAKETLSNAVSNSYEEFAVTYSQYAAPTEGWSTETPEYVESIYIWRRMVVTYGDGTIEIGNPVLVTGNTGETGPQGPQGDKGDTGKTGPKGDQGVNVVATYRYYKLQDPSLADPPSPTTETPSGWADTEPTYIEGSTDRLYFTDKTVFSNDTFSYSSVSISSSYEASKSAYNKAVNAQNTANTANDKANNAQNTANEAAKVATNYIGYESGTGLVVGDMTTDTLGKNTLIDANGMAVRDNTTELARFGSNRVDLGKNNADTTISMRNDNLVISNFNRGDIDYTQIGCHGNFDVSSVVNETSEQVKRGGILTTIESNNRAEWRYFATAKWSELASDKWNKLNDPKFASKLGTYFETRIYADHTDQNTANGFNTSRLYLRNAIDPEINRIESELGLEADNIKYIYKNEFSIDRYDYSDVPISTPIKVVNDTGDTILNGIRSHAVNGSSWLGLFASNEDAINSTNRKAWIGHNGTIHFNIQNQAGGDNYVNKAWTVSSDKRLKHDIETIPNIFIDIWKEIEPKIFRWNELNYDIEQKYQFGIIAQDAIAAFDKYGLDYRDYNLVNTFEMDGIKYFNVTYEHYNMLTSLALKAAINRLDNLESRLKRLEELIK